MEIEDNAAPKGKCIQGESVLWGGGGGGGMKRAKRGDNNVWT